MFFSSDPAVSSSIFVGAEREELIRFITLFVPTLSSGAIVLPIEKMNQINTKNYWK